MNGELKLLVEWSSPWREFVTAIRPALGKSPARLAGEARTELFPYRGMLLAWIAEAALLIAVIVIPARLAYLHPYQPPVLPKYDVIYFSGDELPQTEDLGGAKAGHAGRAGGTEAFHRSQVIRVTRGDALREKVVDAPKLDLPQTDSAVANLLAYKPVPGPAPAEGLKPSLRAPALQTAAAAPPPEIDRQKLHAAPAMNPAIVPPSPGGPQRDFSAAHIPGSQAVTVVPPPVSAPEQMTNSRAQLTLPASVVAPPPAQIPDPRLAKGPGFGAGDLQRQIVPPPVQVSGSGNGRAMGGFGTSDVIAPPVMVSGARTERTTIASLGSPGIVPPPVQIGGGTLRGTGMSGIGGGSVVAPPVDVPGNSSLSGHGRGNRGNGFGSPLDAGSVVAPPSNTGGNAGGSGIVLSSQPGSKVGVPGGGGAGSLALSPAGGLKPGYGGPGSGSGIAQGNGSGSAISGEGTGAANSGAGLGADLNARNGISPFPGPGGAGTGNVSRPPLPGVSVHGGSNVITLPSFGGGDADPPAQMGRSTQMAKNLGPDITVVGSSRSGGAFNFYGTLKGDKVYTIYIDTALGTAVLEYADPASATHPYAEDLQAPMPLRAELPPHLQRARLVIACVLDRSGMLRKPQVLESVNPDLTAKVIAALSTWKFRPVFRGEQPIEVNAILGFDIDTR